MFFDYSNIPNHDSDHPDSNHPIVLKLRQKQRFSDNDLIIYLKFICDCQTYWDATITTHDNDVLDTKNNPLHISYQFIYEIIIGINNEWIPSFHSNHFYGRENQIQYYKKRFSKLLPKFKAELLAKGIL